MTLENLIVFIIMCSAAIGIFYLCYFLFRRWIEGKGYLQPLLLRKHLHHSGLLFLSSILLYLFVHLVQGIPNGLQNILSHAAKIFLIGSVGYFIYKISIISKLIILKTYNDKQYKDLTIRIVKTRLQLIYQLLNIIIATCVVGAILFTFDKVKELGGTVLASAGIATVVIGLAAQRSLSTIFTGIQIAMAQPIKIDDTVRIGDKVGNIADIKLTYVVVKTWDGKRIIVPINYFIENTIENWTHESPEIFGVVQIFTDYSVAVNELRDHFYNVLHKNKLWDKRSANFLVINSDTNSITIRAHMSAANPDDAFALECYIREELINFIKDKYPGALPQIRIKLEGNETLKFAAKNKFT
ncbi:MAG TPA: mechanosensitive ion channel domain-containing protein [Gammaproteobacteria bacterium]|nr:mechanosensitive ion channel domain-containing protein [Gammaproteobacteria bacterium]